MVAAASAKSMLDRWEFKIIGRPVASDNFRTGRKSGLVGKMLCPVAGSSVD
jgi:hypothetical protein